MSITKILVYYNHEEEIFREFLMFLGREYKTDYIIKHKESK
jgi:hypothetical protein